MASTQIPFEMSDEDAEKEFDAIVLPNELPYATSVWKEGIPPNVEGIDFLLRVSFNDSQDYLVARYINGKLFTSDSEYPVVEMSEVTHWAYVKPI